MVQVASLLFLFASFISLPMIHSNPGFFANRNRSSTPLTLHLRTKSSRQKALWARSIAAGDGKRPVSPSLPATAGAWACGGGCWPVNKSAR